MKSGSATMSEHERHALRHPRIVEFHKFYSEYHIFFNVDDERFKVLLRIYETHDGRFFFEQSHFIRTPVYDGTPALPRVTEAEAHLALKRGVETMTTYYEDAVGLGHAPSLDWFVPNKLF